MDGSFRHSRVRIWLGLGVLLVVAGAVTLAAVWYHNFPLRHFQEVRQGVLYRSCQPKEDDLNYLVNRYHIRTIVNFRGTFPQESWWMTESQFCQRNGVKFIDAPLNEKAEIEPSLRAFLAVATDPQSQPVLVHCEAGSARTGFACAAYRILVDRWSHADALAEAKRFRFKPEVNMNPFFDSVLRSLTPGMDWRSVHVDTQTTIGAANQSAVSAASCPSAGRS